MLIEKIPAAKLNPAAYNPRKDLKPGDKEYEKLKRSIEEFGYVEPIIWNKRTGNIVGGHQRYKVLTALGYKEIDCVVVDLDEQREKALNIALNKIQGDWDVPLLTALLKDLEKSGFDATITGFDVNEISDLFDDQSEIVEDEVPEPPEEPITKPGDLWILGRHRLLCGDSTVKEDFETLMRGNVADLVVTDPPYNVSYEGGTADALTIANDSQTDEQFTEFLTKAFTNIHIALKAGGVFYIWHANLKAVPFYHACRATLGEIRQILIWNKSAFTMGRFDYHWKHEPCIYGWKDGAAHYFVDDRKQSTVIEDYKTINIKALKKDEMQKLLADIFCDRISTTVINEDKPSRSVEHPTMKPLKLLARLIKNSSRQGELVLDPFGGSGSTLITCEQLGRTCYMMELDPKYVDVIVKRWLKFTGAEHAELVRNGKESVVKANML